MIIVIFHFFNCPTCFLFFSVHFPIIPQHERPCDGRYRERNRSIEDRDERASGKENPHQDSKISAGWKPRGLGNRRAYHRLEALCIIPVGLE